MHRIIFRLAHGLAFAVLALGMTGCWGPSRFEVAGHVKYNGAPLARPGGQIVFVGPDGSQAPASIELDGSYRAVNVTAGLNRVAVYYTNPAIKNIKRHRGELPPNAPLPSPFLTPESYASVDTSNLSIQVEKPTVFDVELEGPAIP